MGSKNANSGRLGGNSRVSHDNPGKIHSEFAISSHSQSSFSSGLLCHCNTTTKIRTAYTARNYGRRFMGCAYYTSNGSSGCNFFKWYDGAFHDQEEATIAKLVKQNKDLEARNLVFEQKLKEKEQDEIMSSYLNRVVVVAVVLILGVIALKM